VFELSERCGDQTLVHHLAELVGVIDIKDTHKVSRVIMKSGFIAVFGEILDWCCGRQSDGGFLPPFLMYSC